MSKCFRGFLLGLIGMALFAGCDSMGSRDKKLIMASDYSYYPYEYYNVVGKPEGFDLQVAESLAGALGKRLVIKTIPFSKQGDALEKGKIDIILNGMTITPEREKKFKMIPYHKNIVDFYYLVFYKHKPDSLKSIEELKNYPEITVAAHDGTLKADYLSSIAGLKFKTYKTSKRLLRNLKNGRVSAVLLEPEEAGYFAKRDPHLVLFKVPLPKERWTDTMGIAINKENIALQEKVSAAIEKLRKSGELRQLEEGWFDHRSKAS